jgi:hypothetical protein
VGISGNEVADGLARLAVESGTVQGQMTVANDHRLLARQPMVATWLADRRYWSICSFNPTRGISQTMV